MKKGDKLLAVLCIITGFASLAFFVFDAFVFLRAKPKMVAFEALSDLEFSLLNTAGVGLLVMLAFFGLSLLRIAIYLKRAEGIRPFPLVVLILSVLAFLMVFADAALLGDIGKQYDHGFSQPEWTLVLPIMGFQFLAALGLMVLHLNGFFIKAAPTPALRDANIFLVVQVMGLFCGLMGLGTAGLGFLFPRGWTPLVHTVFSMVILLLPYGLGLGYWLVIKLGEKDRQWLDEKQQRDVGRASFLTLILVSLLMVILFIANYGALDGVVRMLWLPFYIFAALFTFSLGNLYFSQRA